MWHTGRVHVQIHKIYFLFSDSNVLIKKQTAAEKEDDKAERIKEEENTEAFHIQIMWKNMCVCVPVCVCVSLICKSLVSGLLHATCIHIHDVRASQTVHPLSLWRCSEVQSISLKLCYKKIKKSLNFHINRGSSSLDKCVFSLRYSASCS